MKPVARIIPIIFITAVLCGCGGSIATNDVLGAYTARKKADCDGNGKWNRTEIDKFEVRRAGDPSFSHITPNEFNSADSDRSGDLDLGEIGLMFNAFSEFRVTNGCG